MPYTLPTAAQFKAKFPTFAAVADPTITLAITEASASVDRGWVEADYQPAILYLAAHIMTIDGVVIAGSDLGSAGGVINAGLVSEMKVGDVQVKLSGSAGGSSGSAGGDMTGLRSTGYGRRYVELLRRNQSGPILV
jgi:hypothetical protein